MLLTPGAKKKIFNEVQKEFTKHGFDCQVSTDKHEDYFTITLFGTDLGYHVRTSKKPKDTLVQFHQINSHSFFTVFLDSPDEIVQFINNFVLRKMSGNDSMLCILDKGNLKKTVTFTDLDGVEVTVSTNVMYHAMARDLVMVNNAKVNNMYGVDLIKEPTKETTNISGTTSFFS